MSAEKVCNRDHMIVERLFARGFVAIGGIFWISAVFGGDYGYRGISPMVSARNALLPLLLTIVVLGIGWFYERFVAISLVAGAAAVVAWGVVSGWEMGVWSLVGLTLVAPMLVSASLYWMASRMERVCSIADARAAVGGAAASL
jgi:hypothetical protein